MAHLGRPQTCGNCGQGEDDRQSVEMILRSHDRRPDDASGQRSARDPYRRDRAKSTRPRSTVNAHGRKVARQTLERQKFRRNRTALTSDDQITDRGKPYFLPTSTQTRNRPGGST